MASLKLTPLLLFLILLPSSISSPTPTNSPSPNSSTLDSIKNAIDEVEKATAIMSTLVGAVNGSRLGHAIDDCLELLQLSSDELHWALGSVSGNVSITAYNKANVVAWLTAALTNQDTCLRGLVEVADFFELLYGRCVKMVEASIEKALTDSINISTVADDTMASLHGLIESPMNGTSFVVVAADGSGNFTTITEAVKSAPDYSDKRYVIYVKKGIYKEHVVVPKQKKNLMIMGDSMFDTIITGNRSHYDGWSTFGSATFAVSAPGFIAQNIGFENTAGAGKHQAVAFRSTSDLAVCYRCAFKGYQGTLYAHSGRQLYRECIILGTVDFIIGNAAAVFQDSVILGRKPMDNQINIITAQGRKYGVQKSGFSIQRCLITVVPGPDGPPSSTPMFLGRPWGPFSTTVVMQSYLGGAVHYGGWILRGNNNSTDALYFGEYMNFGPGAGLEGRVNWRTRVIPANKFTVAELIDGDQWLPSSGISYIPDLG